MAEQAKTFQNRTTDMVRQQVQELLNSIPELRSVVVVFDWEELLNEIALPGLWMSREGLVGPQQSVLTLGAMTQVQKMFQVQQQVALKMLQGLDQAVANKSQLLKSIEDRLDARKREFDQTNDDSETDTGFETTGE